MDVPTEEGPNKSQLCIRSTTYYILKQGRKRFWGLQYFIDSGIHDTSQNSHDRGSRDSKPNAIGEKDLLGTSIQSFSSTQE